MSRLGPALLLAALLPTSALAEGHDLRGALTKADGSRVALEVIIDGESVYGDLAVRMVVEDTALGDVTLEGALLSDGVMLLHGYAMAHLLVLEADCFDADGGLECAGDLHVVSGSGSARGSVILRGDDDASVVQWSMVYDSLNRGLDADEEHLVTLSLTHDTEFEAWATMIVAPDAEGFELAEVGRCQLLKNDQDGIFSSCTDGDGRLCAVIHAPGGSGDSGGFVGVALALSYVEDALPNRDFGDLWAYAVKLSKD
jgi:hypothetical protein